MASIQLTDAATYYEQKEHQSYAWHWLQDQLTDAELTSFAELYRTEPDKPDKENPLDVKYFWQQDNGPEGWRQCQTSSIAMCLHYLGVEGINDDVDYLRIVKRYGDTTLQSSHQQALKSLGVPARFRTDGGKQDLINRINSGYPSAIGILHHGPVSAPSGGGHYIVVIGYTDTHAICHDPYSELNLVAGTWQTTGEQEGNCVKYSWKNLLPRWDLNNGTADGWYWEIDSPGKADGGGSTAAPTKTGNKGTALIRSFEGLRLEAYPDPASGGDPWTIGYGHTGSEVVPGLKITEAVANQYLRDDLARFEEAVTELIEVPFNQDEFDATVSFAFNCGSGALESSTFRRRINAGEDKATCFKEEFPRWTTGGMPGLVRRRDAEVKLAVEGLFP